MDKNVPKNAPVLAILADMPPLTSQYLADVALMAGWNSGTADGADYAASVLLDDAGKLVFSDGTATTMMPLPVRAGNIIQYLKTLQEQSVALPAEISIGTYILKPRDYLLVDREGQALRLTEKETAILVCLSQQEKGKPVSRQALLDGVWAYAQGVETHTLETHIYRLRQKIEVDPANPQILLTLDEGYSLVI